MATFRNTFFKYRSFRLTNETDHSFKNFSEMYKKTSEIYMNNERLNLKKARWFLFWDNNTKGLQRSPRVFLGLT